MSVASEESSYLFSPLTIRGVTIRNRISVSPMCQYSCEDGFVNDWHLVNLGSFARGGAGLVIAESTGVEPRGRISPGCAGIWKDEHIAPWKRIVDFIKSQGSVAGIQLGHAGRKTTTVVPWQGKKTSSADDGGWPTIAPSPIPFGDQVTKVPKEATIEDIEEIKEAFVSAAIRSVKAGFEVIELHFAHGYLVSIFLSPITNLRKDKYGGSLENRMRLALEIAEKIRNAVPDNIVIGVRIAVTDYVDGGWDLEQTIEFSKRLKEIGIDFVDCSSGGVVSDIEYANYQTNVVQWNAAKAIQKEAGIASGIVGEITDPEMAEKFIREDWATIVFIGRAFLYNPHWPFEAADALGVKSFNCPPQYDWAIGWNSIFKRRRNQAKTDKARNRPKYVCPDDFIRLGNSCYYLSPTMDTWHEAYFDCRDRDSELAVIEKKWEDKYLRTFLNKNELARLERWIGGIYDWQSMVWVWGSSGTPLGYQGFSKKTVSSDNRWKCISMDPTHMYRWSPKSCLQHKHYICEVPLVKVKIRQNDPN